MHEVSNRDEIIGKEREREREIEKLSNATHKFYVGSAQFKESTTKIFIPVFPILRPHGTT